jgi:hypothetical protein
MAREQGWAVNPERPFLGYYELNCSIKILLNRWRGTRYRSCLRYYATSWKVAGSIPDDVIGFLNSIEPSNRTVALGSSQPLTTSTRNLPGSKGRPARTADNFTADCLENVGTSTFHNRMGLQGLLQG